MQLYRNIKFNITKVYQFKTLILYFWNNRKHTLAGTISLAEWITCDEGVIISGETFWDSIIERCNDVVTIRFCAWAVIWDRAGANPIVFISASLFTWTYQKDKENNQMFVYFKSK